MNSRSIAIFVLIVGLATAVFFGWSTLVKNSRSMFSQSNTVTPTPNVATAFETIINQPLSLDCTYSEEGEKTRLKIKNGKIRGAITSSQNETTNIIYKDKEVYMWGQGPAIKVKVTPKLLEKASGRIGLGGLEDINNYSKYCREAQISDNEFVLPKGINFKDYSSLVDMLP